MGILWDSSPRSVLDPLLQPIGSRVACGARPALGSPTACQAHFGFCVSTHCTHSLCVVTMVNRAETPLGLTGDPTEGPRWVVLPGNSGADVHGLGGGLRWGHASCIGGAEARNREASGTRLVWAEAGSPLPVLSIMGCSEALPAGQSPLSATQPSHWQVSPLVRIRTTGAKLEMGCMGHGQDGRGRLGPRRQVSPSSARSCLDSNRKLIFEGPLPVSGLRAWLPSQNWPWSGGGICTKAPPGTGPGAWAVTALATIEMDVNCI